MERNIMLDYFRIILCLLVITVHTQFLFSSESLSGWLISNGIARIGVPCFFVISGYYLHPKLSDNKALKRYLSHIFIVYIVWSFIYLPTYYNTVEARSLVTFAIMGYYHLWFLPALLLGTLMLAVIKKFIKNNNLILLSGIIFYITGYILENSGLPYRSFCNGIFFGFPFIVSGYYIREKDFTNIAKAPYLYALLPVSLIALLTESYQGYKTNIYHNLFLSLYILCPVLIICIQKGAKYTVEKYDISKLAAGIYLVHILVAGQIIPIAETNNIYRLPFIMIVSVLLAIFIVLINKRIKILL